MNSLNLVDIKNQSMSIWESTDDLKQIKEIYGKNLSAGEFNTLVQMGKATGLNPFLKEIWAVKYGDTPAQIFIGRDGYRKSAQRHPLYDYHVSDAVYSADTFNVINGEVEHKYNLSNRGTLVGAYCIVQRKGSSRPSYVFVELKEYSTGKSLWNPQTGKQATMIKKVAEAQGLKSAFQELFAGTYSEYEQYEENTEMASSTKPGKGVKGLKEKLGMVKEEHETFDNETGEVIDAVIVDAPYSIDIIKSKIENALNLDELAVVVDMTNSLPEKEKNDIRELYKAKKLSLSKGDF